MWVIKFLDGPLSGKEFEIKHQISIGRDPSNEIQLEAHGISKKHAHFLLINNKIELVDTSSNGTFVNGYRVQKQTLENGDKISFYNILCKISSNSHSLTLASLKNTNHLTPPTQAASELAVSPPSPTPPSAYNNALNPWDFQTPNHLPPSHESPSEKTFQSPLSNLKSNNLSQNLSQFIDQKVMPNILDMTKSIDFKTLFWSFAAVFILMVTLLSIIPLNIITSESIQNEAYQRVLTVARGLASINEQILRSDDFRTFKTELIFKEPGIKDTYIIGKDGFVLAPNELAGNNPKHISFARRVRGQAKEFVENENGLLIAAVPIIIYDPDLNQNIAKAHVIVSYEVEALKYDDQRIMSLFIQVLIISSLVGLILFYILYKLAEYPFKKIIETVNFALKNEHDQIQMDIKLPILNDLVTIINLLLTRAHQSISQPTQNLADRKLEFINLLELIGYPSLIIETNYHIFKVNKAFEELLGVTPIAVEGRSLDSISDPALQQNIKYLIDQASINSTQIIQDSLEIKGHHFILSCQTVSMNSPVPDTYIVTIMPQAEENHS